MKNRLDWCIALNRNADEIDRSGHPYFPIGVLVVCVCQCCAFGRLQWDHHYSGGASRAVDIFLERKSQGRSLIDIDLNSADISELTLLPRIGPVLAERITVYRKEHGAFKSIEDLQMVRGVGPKTIDEIRTIAVAQPRILDHQRVEVPAEVLD